MYLLLYKDGGWEMFKSLAEAEKAWAGKKRKYVEEVFGVVMVT